MKIYQDSAKRVSDILGAGVLLIAVLPACILIGVIVKLDSPGPVFFSQRRVGRGGHIFRVRKFRTMTDEPHQRSGEVLPADPHVTRVGAWLRRLKLDEFPQLWNVLTGEMSLVGPRPDLPEHCSSYDQFGLKRLQVRPGLTGLAQVSGNIHLSWPERWRLDARYVDELSLRTDVRILMRTIAVVIFGERRFVRRPLLEGESLR